MQLISIADLARPEHELAPLLQIAQSLSEIWSDFVKQDNEAYSYVVETHGEASREDGIHASEMNDCMLRLVYAILGVERRQRKQEADRNMKHRFRAGTALHAMIQSDFERMSAWYTAQNRERGLALTFEREVRVDPEKHEIAKTWEIHSGCDGIFTFWVYRDGQWQPYLRVGVEIKSSSALEYDKRTKPEPKHAKQACLYQRCLDIPLMWTVYYNKSNSNYTTPHAPWLFKYDWHLWENEIEMRFAKAHHHADTRQMPPRTEGRHCGWCPFAYHCGPEILKKKDYGNPAISSGLGARRLT